MMRPLLLLGTALISQLLCGQAYVFQQASGPYVPLSSPTPCTFDANGFDEVSELDGQVFSLFGYNYTAGSPVSLLIGDWGFLRVEGSTTAVIIDGLFTSLQAVDSTSSVSYSISGSPGAYVWTAQWHYWHLSEGPPANHASFQISLEQATGIASVHIGPNSGGGANIFTNITGPNCGIFRANSNFTTCLGKLWVEGDPASPSIDVASNFDFDALTSFPAEGTIYRFVPAAIAGVEDLEGTNVRTFVASDGIHVQLPGLSGTAQLSLLDATGREVMHTTATSAAVVLPMQGLAPGIHVLRVNGVGAARVLVP